MFMDRKTWESPKIEDIGNAKEIIQNVFRLGTGDTEPGMVNTLESA